MPGPGIGTHSSHKGGTLTQNHIGNILFSKKGPATTTRSLGHDIPAGSDWHGAIGTGLVHCRGIVPIITNKYIASRYCTNEVCTCTCTVVDHKWCRERERNTKCNTIGIQLVWWLLKSGTEQNGSAY